jgi:hypothetical protein
MAAYKATFYDNGVIRVSDNAFIPNDPANGDYQNFVAWRAAGGTLDPAETPAETAARAVRENDAAAQETLRADLKNDAVLAQLKNASPAQINTFINNQFPAFTVQQRAVIRMLVQVAATVVKRL